MTWILQGLPHHAHPFYPSTSTTLCRSRSSTPKSGDSDGGTTSVYPEDRVDLCFGFLWDSLFAGSPHNPFLRSLLILASNHDPSSYYLSVCCSNITFNLQFTKRRFHAQTYLSESRIHIFHLLQIPCGCLYQLRSGELVDSLPFVYFVVLFSLLHRPLAVKPLEPTRSGH